MFCQRVGEAVGRLGPMASSVIVDVTMCNYLDVSSTAKENCCHNMLSHMLSACACM